mgnify:CR=1 FL=1
MVYFIQQTLVFCIPLMIVALAGVFAERSGIINIALEGIMVFGAFVGVLCIRLFLAAGFPPEAGQLLLIIVILITMLFGGLFALLLAYASINLKADQTIGGTALNLLAPALVLFLILIISQQNVLNIDSMYSSADLFMLFQEDFGLGTKMENPLGVIGNILFNKVFLTTIYAIVLYVVLSIILYKTKLGLRLRSCGEHPQAAASLGINVYNHFWMFSCIWWVHLCTNSSRMYLKRRCCWSWILSASCNDLRELETSSDCACGITIWCIKMYICRISIYRF